MTETSEMKSAYAEWLVISDIDGTLNDKKRNLPENNLKAIGEFTARGGNFTLASGRSPQSMRKHYEKLPIGNIPAVVMDGAGIYDFAKEEMIYFSSFSEESTDAVIEIARSFPTIDTVIFTKDSMYVTGIGLWGAIFTSLTHLEHKKVRDIRKVPRGDWGKVFFCGPYWRVNHVRRHIKKMKCESFCTTDSSVASVVVLEKGTGKGTAINKLAEMLGIEKEKVCAIGDYYNDLEMLISVSVPACCGQAPEKLKKVSEYVACHCNQGAVADFLNYIVTKKIRS